MSHHIHIRPYAALRQYVRCTPGTKVYGIPHKTPRPGAEGVDVRPWVKRVNGQLCMELERLARELDK